MNIYPDPRTVSTLLIPNRLIADFNEKSKDIGREMVLHKLILKYKPLIFAGLFSKKSRVKTVFQSDGENLIRKNLRPENADWLEFGLLADFVGVSRCALFVLLFSLEIGEGSLLVEKIFWGNEVPSSTESILQRRGIFGKEREHYEIQIRKRGRQQTQKRR